MSQEFIKILAENFNLDHPRQELLAKVTRRLNRTERRLYFETVKPLEREMKIFLKGEYEQLNREKRLHWIDLTVSSLLEKGGEAAIIDGIMMDVMGRLEVYRNLRQRSEDEGHALRALVSFGGLSMVLVSLVIVTAIVLYIMNWH